LLALALVASSVDTLQSGLASLLSTHRPGRSASLIAARWITVLLMVPVLWVAVQGLSVLRLFLIADLLCATAVVPVLLGLWSRMTPTAALVGCLAGLIGAVAPGWLETGSVWQGVVLASFPSNTPTLAPFVAALLASSLACVGVAMWSSRASPPWAN
jgi:Na+(H+)/acetate symporter ActP